ncbi:MAG: hypothetical protein IKM20_10395 [Erysipelotrichales bacterium]|nr:hypothetical protein [Erysipelotrichales bacterium]
MVNKKEINEFYKKLYDKAKDLMNPFLLAHGKYNCKMGFYNGHYYKNYEGIYEFAFYPIPVISIVDYCDIEVDIDTISISTKLSRNQAEVFDYSLLEEYYFEAYGVENYLDDYYTKDSTIDEFIERIKTSNEQNIAFSFLLDNVNSDELYTFVEFLVKNGFFY